MYYIDPPFRYFHHGQVLNFSIQLQEAIIRTLDKKVEKFHLKFLPQEVIKGTDNVTVLYMKRFQLSGSIVGSKDISRDETENIFVQYFIKGGFNISMIGQTAKTQIHFDNTAHVLNLLNFSSSRPETSDQAIVLEFESKLIPKNTIPSTIPRVMSFARQDMILISPTLSCAHISLLKDEFKIDMNINGSPHNALKLKIYGNELMMGFDELSAGIWIESDNIKICKELLLSISLQTNDSLSYSNKRSWLEIFSLIMLSLSITCLALTLLVYSCLPVLRTVPGQNTMGTCAALLLAQALLLLASEQVLAGKFIWCQVLAIALHGSWLCFFSWNWLCSLHMYHTFSATTFHRSTTRNKIMLVRNILFSVLAPAIVIVAVVIGSYISSGGENIGYSPYRCYLESLFLIGIAMILPVSLILFINLILFIITINKIGEVRLSVSFII